MVGASQDDASIVVLAKALGAAKTRLGLDRESTEQVALHLALATVRAAVKAEHSGRVFVVTSDPRISQGSAHLGAAVTPEGRPRGINRAAALGREQALRERPLAPVAVMVADLPLVRSHQLDAIIARFLEGEVPLFVPDHHMVGTTFLIHSHRSRPGLAFGRQSALMHRLMGYLPAMRAPRGLRVDLDAPGDVEDLLSGKWCADLSEDSTQIQRLLQTLAGGESGDVRTQSLGASSPRARVSIPSRSINGSAGQRADGRFPSSSTVKEI